MSCSPSQGGLCESSNNCFRASIRRRQAAMSVETIKVEPADSEQDEEEDVYEVERIIDMRVEEVNRAKCYVAAWLAWQTWLALLLLYSDA